MLNRVLGFFTSDRGPLRLAAVAFVISLPALLLGFQADDHLFALARALDMPAWALFTLTGERMAEQRLRGFFSWFASPRLAVNFLRPLTSLNHWVEFTVFPNTPAAMLFVNVVIYASIVWLAAALYRKLAPDSWIAALAGLMFVLDDGHANSVGWISARNTLLATLFSFAALYAHVRASETSRRWLQWVSAGCVSLALLTGEAGVWSVALLIAYAALLDERRLALRAWSLAPQLAAAGAWAAFYLYTGPHGIPGSSWYRELSHPGETLTEGVLDLPTWAATLFGGGSGNTALSMRVTTARLLGLALALPPLAWLALVVNKTQACRFFALATLLCLLPLLMTVPEERTLIGPSFGGFGWIACYVGDAAMRSTSWRRLGRTVLLVIHVSVSLVQWPIALSTIRFVENGVQALLAVLPPVRQVVILNAPLEMLNNYAMSALSLPVNLSRRPESSYVLYGGASDLVVTRPQADSIDVRVHHGWAYVLSEHTFCAKRELPRRGERRQLLGMSATVLESTPDGRPGLVRFQFDGPLEAKERGWLRWRGRRPEAWRPPPLGSEETIVGTPLLTSLPLGLR